MKRKRGGIVSQLLMILLVVVIIFPLYFMTANAVLEPGMVTTDVFYDSEFV